MGLLSELEALTLHRAPVTNRNSRFSRIETLGEKYLRVNLVSVTQTLGMPAEFFHLSDYGQVRIIYHRYILSGRLSWEGEVNHRRCPRAQSVRVLVTS